VRTALPSTILRPRRPAGPISSFSAAFQRNLPPDPQKAALGRPRRPVSLDGSERDWASVPPRELLGMIARINSEAYRFLIPAGEFPFLLRRRVGPLHPRFHLVSPTLAHADNALRLRDCKGLLKRANIGESLALVIEFGPAYTKFEQPIANLLPARSAGPGTPAGFYGCPGNFSHWRRTP